MLDDFETFYGFQEVRDRYKKNVFALFEALKHDFPAISHVRETLMRLTTSSNHYYQVSIYGELFGGIYPHPDAKDIGAQPIQRGVYVFLCFGARAESEVFSLRYYCPYIEFYAFDIELNYSDHAEW